MSTAARLETLAYATDSDLDEVRNEFDSILKSQSDVEKAIDKVWSKIVCRHGFRSSRKSKVE